jgi:signal transduction histidine kinase
MVQGFSSMVSHESRTALTGIQGWSELIRDGDLTPEETREYAQYIFQDAQRVNRLIGELLDLNRLETAQSGLQRARVDINRVITEAAERIRSTHDYGSLTLQLGDDLPPVAGDSERLSEVIANLLRFALSTSPSSEMYISSSSLPDEVEVTLPAGLHTSVDFDDWLNGRYERYENRPSQVIGAGLGLAIARVIVELHGGRIWVDEAAGRGAEFHFTLPAHA